MELIRPQRQRHRQDSNPASGLGSSYRGHCEGDDRGTLAGSDSAGPRKAVRSTHTLYTRNDCVEGTSSNPLNASTCNSRRGTLNSGFQHSSYTDLLQTLTFKLMPKIDDSIKAEIVKWSAFYEHRIRTGSKVIFHLEAFVAKFMRIYEGWVDVVDSILQAKLTFSTQEPDGNGHGL